MTACHTLVKRGSGVQSQSEPIGDAATNDLLELVLRWCTVNN
jgi:hypothetical protein